MMKSVLNLPIDEAIPTFGVNSSNYVMVDVDEMDVISVYQLAVRGCEFHDLGGFIMYRSSESGYHLVFDKYFDDYLDVLQVVSWFGIVSHNENIWKWVCMQLIKGYSTLRVGEKRIVGMPVKPSPELVATYGDTGNACKYHHETFEAVIILSKTWNK